MRVLARPGLCGITSPSGFTPTAIGMIMRCMLKRPQKITFAEMRSLGVRGLLIYCSDYRCSHWTASSADRWPDDARLSDLGVAVYLPGLRPADVRPNWKSVEEYA